ncbi:pseudouridine synthase [Ideonella sp. DXS29W]|uniref:Dual-specificity RNA pseudouridine synthase RluF n=1 Tax=Ideonella lacteola TaxID=2984193 RepID=A0ABU9BMT9_9BURK
MRSDRHIQRTPKRPVRSASSPDAPAPATAPTPAPSAAASVPVTIKPPSAPAHRGSGRPPREGGGREGGGREGGGRDAGRNDRSRHEGGRDGRDRDSRDNRGYEARSGANPARPGQKPDRRPPSGRDGGGFGSRSPDRADRPSRPERPERPERAARPERSHTHDRPERQPAPPAAGPRRVPRDEAPPPMRPAPKPPTPRTSDAEGVRLSKLLGDRGLASRREADDWIAAGWVKVDGQMAVLGQRVLPDAKIEIDPAAHQQQAQRVTILLHKPIGYVSGQAEDGYEPASVLVTAANRWTDDPHKRPFHPGHARHLAPAGRLDIDSTGLLVLTQDGRIAKHLIGEDSDVEKEYLVRVEYQGQAQAQGTFPETDLKRLQHGLELDGKKLQPAKVSWANEDQLRFVLREGRKRQIRRMCELVGLKVVGLKRVRIGSVVLGKLPVGQWRYLGQHERF